MKKHFYIFAMLLTISIADNAEAISLYTHSEAAPKNALFFDIGLAAYNIPDNFEVYIPKMRIAADWMFSVSLPISLGGFLVAPFPNLTDFGVRIAYHINFESENIDFYLLYCFNLGFVRNKELRYYGLEEVPIHYFDFRAGFRYIFSYRVGVLIETGYKLNSIMIGATVRIF